MRPLAAAVGVDKLCACPNRPCAQHGRSIQTRTEPLEVGGDESMAATYNPLSFPALPAPPTPHQRPPAPPAPSAR